MLWRKEKRVHTTLYFHELDEGLYPELERPPGVYAIEPYLVQPGQDKRIPAPKETPVVLLVSFTLLAKMVPQGAAWEMEIDGVLPDGKPKHLTVALIEPPPERDNMQPITPDPSIRLDPGTVFRGVFWVDLLPLMRDKSLQRGDRLILRYGTATASVAIPAAGPTR
jgi:hypothetical protein